MQLGNLGDAKSVGGGDKGSQPRDIARARGMTQIAHDAGMGRQALYKSLGEGGNPTLTTTLGVIKSLGLTLSVRP